MNMAASEEEKPPLLVVAMDFGTTFSGYAFATLGDYKNDPLSISTHTWATGSQTGMSLKTPTCILFDSAENFVAFGKDAEDKYTILAQENNHKGWHYFRRFKMDLYKTGPQVNSSCYYQRLGSILEKREAKDIKESYKLIIENN